MGGLPAVAGAARRLPSWRGIVRPALALVSWLIAASTAHAFAMLQDRLLYFPERAALESVVAPPWQPWPAHDAFRGLLLAPAGPVRATVIVFHGNAGHAGHRVHYGAALAPLGLRIVLAEYPGYGPRGGALGEPALVEDATQTIALARAHFGAPLLVIGESLGAGVAAAAVARAPAAADGLMLITPWDRLRSVAEHHYPWLPVGWLLRDRYDSVHHLAAFGGPKLVVVAGSDAIVPPAFGRALAAALPGRRRLLTIEGAGHNDWPDHVDGRWWADAIGWLLAPPPR